LPSPAIFLIPKAEGAIGDDHIVGEIGGILAGRVRARGSRDEITLFKSLGIAVEDLAAAHHIESRARAEGKGSPSTSEATALRTIEAPNLDAIRAASARIAGSALRTPLVRLTSRTGRPRSG